MNAALRTSVTKLPTAKMAAVQTALAGFLYAFSECVDDCCTMQDFRLARSAVNTTSQLDTFSARVTV